MRTEKVVSGLSDRQTAERRGNAPGSSEGVSFGSEFKAGRGSNTERFPRFNFLHCTFGNDWEEAIGAVGSSFEGLVSGSL